MMLRELTHEELTRMLDVAWEATGEKMEWTLGRHKAGAFYRIPGIRHIRWAYYSWQSERRNSLYLQWVAYAIWRGKA